MPSSDAPALSAAPRRVLTVEGLTKRFHMHHLGAELAPITDVSLTVDAGEFVLLRGPNGAGKSTLLRTIYRSCRAEAGHVWFEAEAGGRIDLARAADIDVASLRKREIGFVTQFLAARPRVSAEDLVAEPLREAGEAQAEARAEAQRWLAAFGVRTALWPAYPTTFSGGEQQKVNLARALILRKQLLLLDEPTASLDQGARAALVQRLTELKSQGVALIGVFHHPGDVAHLVDRTIDLPGAPPHAPSNDGNEEERQSDVAV